MDRPNRPYRGMQAEIAEREARLATQTTAPKDKDSVIDAAGACLIIGAISGLIGSVGFYFLSFDSSWGALATTIGCTGLFFLLASGVMGVYAMATHRLKQGLIIASISMVLFTGGPTLLQSVMLRAINKELSEVGRDMENFRKRIDQDLDDMKSKNQQLIKSLKSTNKLRPPARKQAPDNAGRGYGR